MLELTTQPSSTSTKKPSQTTHLFPNLFFFFFVSIFFFFFLLSSHPSHHGWSHFSPNPCRGCLFLGLIQTTSQAQLKLTLKPIIPKFSQQPNKPTRHAQQPRRAMWENQIGAKFWEVFCAEHDIDPTKKTTQTCNEPDRSEVFRLDNFLFRPIWRRKQLG